MSNNSSSSGGIGFAGLLAIVFITLKLAGVIAWSWWWVLAPLWIGLALYIAIILGIIAVTFVIGAIVGLVSLVLKHLKK